MKINGTACAAADRKSHAKHVPYLSWATPQALHNPQVCRRCWGVNAAQAQQCRPAAHLISALHHAHTWYACHKFLKLLTSLFDQRMASKRAQPKTFEHKGILYTGIRVGLCATQPHLSCLYLLTLGQIKVATTVLVGAVGDNVLLLNEEDADAPFVCSAIPFFPPEGCCTSWNAEQAIFKMVKCLCRFAR